MQMEHVYTQDKALCFAFDGLLGFFIALFSFLANLCYLSLKTCYSGLFGVPLLCVLKLMSAAKLSATLNLQTPLCLFLHPFCLSSTSPSSSFKTFSSLPAETYPLNSNPLPPAPGGLQSHSLYKSACSPGRKHNILMCHLIEAS